MIETVSREKTELEESITSLQQNINTLETRIQESADRERLMIEYPDLNGPVNPDLNGEFNQLVQLILILMVSIGGTVMMIKIYINFLFEDQN